MLSAGAFFSQQLTRKNIYYALTIRDSALQSTPTPAIMLKALKTKSQGFQCCLITNNCVAVCADADTLSVGASKSSCTFNEPVLVDTTE